MKSLLFDSIAELFNAMDKKWNSVARGYSFFCNGCEDNCCKSLFFHHTHIEKAYLLHGWSKLDQNIREKTLILASRYCSKTFNHTGNIKSLKIYCPLNENGLCLLYRFRPMICRLHGLPNELKLPGRQTIKYPGCSAGLFNDKPYIKLDRTPFYTQMAAIESDFRKKTGKTGKTKESIAQMLLSQ